MKQRSVKEISSIFVTCRDYYLANQHWQADKRKSALLKKMQGALVQTLSSMAALHQVLYPSWSVDADHPGYLIKFDAPMVVRVPYHILPVFPDAHDLQIIWDLSRRVRTGDNSIICVSGSNAIRGMFDLVGDIDFCEYVVIPDREAIERLQSNTKADDELRCIRVAFGKYRWAHPWPNGRPDARFFSRHIDPSDHGRSSCKYDYVGAITTFGVIEVTNMILLCDKDGSSASLTRTFPAQEAPLVPVDWLPNQMADPKEMGRYLDWLIREIAAHRKKADYYKCLKRVASLSRVMFRDDVTNAIAALAQDNPVLMERKLAQMAQLRAVVETMPDPKGRALLDQIEHDIQRFRSELDVAGRPTETQVNDFGLRVEAICDKLVEHFTPRRIGLSGGEIHGVTS